MNITIILIIIGTVISILLFILIKKIGNNTPALPSFPNDGPDVPVSPPVIPSPNQPTFPPTNPGSGGSSDSTATTTPQITTSVPQNSMLIEIFGANFNSSQISKDGSNPTKLIQPNLNLFTPIKSNGLDTSLFNVDMTTGILTGPSNPPGKHYLISITVEVKPLNGIAPTFPSSQEFTATVGLGIPNPNGGIQLLPASDNVENSSKNTSLAWGGYTLGLSTKGQTATRSIPYIYISDPNNLLAGQTNQNIDINIIVKLVND